jgi:hypothetical protein
MDRLSYNYQEKHTLKRSKTLVCDGLLHDFGIPADYWRLGSPQACFVGNARYSTEPDPNPFPTSFAMQRVCHMLRTSFAVSVVSGATTLLTSDKYGF